MEYQKFVKQYNYSTIQIQNKNWLEVNGEVDGNYKVNSQIQFKTTILNSSVCDYSDG